MSFSAGAKLGPYEILSQVGAGGMGEVYRARDPRLNRIVAIKVSAARFSERFEREARAIAALNHFNICQVYDIGPNYLVMEFIEGIPLRGPVPVDEALRYALQICDALDAAHKKNITHRDLKPANILVTVSGVKLLDFGLAKTGSANSASDPDADTEATGLTETGTVLGTAAYMSPEQARGMETDPRSDIFSFGLVFYEMLSGRRAFSGNSNIETMSAILRDEPAPLDVPSNLSAIVTRCLRKLPAGRFQTISEVRAALEQLSTLTKDRSPSIAVLPFANMSRDADDEYFSDGLAEEIINLLAHIPGLKVTARTSAFAFRGKDQDIIEIANALKVRTVLEGSVRRAGSRIRVTVQLINAEDGYHLWSERYDRELTDIFAVQDEIAAAVAKALQLKLAANPTSLQRHAPSLAAYEAYLKARYYQWRTEPGDLARSKEYYDDSIALDPDFALAYVGQADYFLVLAGVGLQPARDVMLKVRQNAQRSLELDPSLPEAHAMLAIVAAHFDHDWREAGRRFQLAMTREPVSPVIRSWYGFFYLAYINQPDKAIEEQQRGLREDPFNALFNWVLAVMFIKAGKLDEAERETNRILEMAPNFLYAYVVAALVCAIQGRWTTALALAEKAFVLGSWYAPGVGVLAAVLEQTGDPNRAEKLLDTIRIGVGASNWLSLFHRCRGDIDSAVEWAEKAVREQNPILLSLLSIDIHTLRGSPRWPSLAKTMNLPGTV